MAVTDDAFQSVSLNETLANEFIAPYFIYMSISGCWGSLFQIGAPQTCVFLMTLFQVLNSVPSEKEKPSLVYIGLNFYTILRMLTPTILSMTYLLQAVINGECNIDLVYQDGEDFTKVGQAVTFAMVAFLAVLDNRSRKSLSESRSSLALWTFAMVSAFIKIHQEFSFAADHLPQKALSLKDIIDAIQFLAIFIGFCRSWLFEETGFTIKDNLYKRKKHSDLIENTEDKASLLSTLIMGWTLPLIQVGFRREIEESDVPVLSRHNICSIVVPRLEKAWKDEESKCDLNEASNKYQRGNEGTEPVQKDHQNETMNYTKLKDFESANTSNYKIPKLKKSVSLLKVLLRAFGFKLCVLNTCRIVFSMHDFLYPLMTAALMNHINNRENESIGNGLFIVVFMFFVYCIANTIENFSRYSITRICAHIRISLAMSIFKKSLTLRNEETKHKTNGEMVSLASDDSVRVCEMGHYVDVIIGGPFKVLIGMYFLYDQLGWPTLLAAVIMPFSIPLNIFFGRLMINFNNRRANIRKKRITLINEMISGIRVLKMYAWEKSFIGKYNNFRKEEIQTLKNRSNCEAAIDSLFTTIPLLVKGCAFGVYLLMGGHMDCKKAFVSIALFSTINDIFISMILSIPDFVEGYSSLKNINAYLNGEEIPPDVTKKVIPGQSANSSAVKVKDGTFSWERASPYPTLRDINVDISKNSLVAIVGVVGCGKSSLLSCILGEMEKLDGSVVVEGRTAYVPQEAWIRNSSLQDNVLFGSSLDDQKYHEVIKCCNLKRDIDMLIAGDQTEIGEKGVNLSGGQKQRTSLARAVYNDADVYLLDDPLSAVDAHVGKSIFNKVISHKGLLKNKTRILVTHGIQWLPFVDSIVVMKDGQIVQKGTFKSLLSCGGSFADFLQDVCSHSSENEDEEVKMMKQNLYQRLNSREYQQQVQQHEEYHNEQDTQETQPKQQHQELQNLYENFDNEEDIQKSDTDEGKDACSQSNSPEAEGKLIVDEELETGAVNKSVYLEFLKALGVIPFTVLIFIHLLNNASERFNEFMIKEWTDQTYSSDGESYQVREWFYYKLFVVSGLFQCIFSFLFVVLVYRSAYKASYKIHNALLSNVMRCPMSFFDTTPSSRIISRFSADTVRIDGLSHCLRWYIMRIYNVLLSLLLLIINAPTILFCVVPLSLLYYALQRANISCFRQLRRFRSKHRSPIWVMFSEVLNGLSSIRAYQCQDRFIEMMEKKVETSLKFDTMTTGVGRWFDIHVTFLNLFIQMAAGVIVVMDSRMTASMAGLVLMYASFFSTELAQLMRLMTFVEAEIVSLERVLNYSKKPTEAPWEIQEHKTKSDWPTDGCIILNDLKLRYREGQDLVLKGVTCDIKKGEKIGIVGRTGAGKSSLTMALFRMIEASEGHIKIDGEKISDLGLHDLRSKITILPQDPIIFAGSLRMNLDPFDKFTTDELWVALKHAHLKSFVEGLDNQLDFECGEGGKNMSVGQRQMLCLARTLLRQTKILVLDEATAAVDMETDKLIQKTIRTEFQDCTVLSIAHRLHTIMDYDRIMVLDQGLVKEFDTPRNLMADKQSVFYGLAQDAKLVR